jgi:hypothetical protein
MTHNLNGRTSQTRSILFTCGRFKAALVTGQQYIHRHSSKLKLAKWPYLATDLIRCIKPGGWIQDMEMSIMWKSDDGTITDDHLLNEWSRISIEAAKKIGKTFENAQFTKENMIKAGFVDVVEKKYKMPVRGWSSDPKMKELGRWNALYFQQGIEGMCLYLLNRVMGVSISLVCGRVQRS